MLAEDAWGKWHSDCEDFANVRKRKENENAFFFYIQDFFDSFN